MSRPVLPLAVLVALVALAPASPVAAQSFVNFETGQVRPLAISPDQSRLFAVNTPDNQLEIFDIGAAGLTHTGSVPVGLEPIAVAAKSDAEVWVVNHLSDSISIVDVSSSPARVTRTLLTCDEPRDIVFAGPANGRAFVTAARRGQNCPVNQDPQTAGIGRAIVQVYDGTSLDGTLAGTPLATLVLFGDTPRSLARSADGSTVYAAIFQSGNETTTLAEPTVCDGETSSPCGAFLQFPGGLPPPTENIEGVEGPPVGLIAKFNRDTGQWEDSIGRDWSAAVRFDLPDLDVFPIDAATLVPDSASYAHVGTVLFDMATNPVSGKVYVSNTEARNEVRFEGPGTFFDSTTVQGHLHEARITVLDGTSVTPRHLNKHIDYDQRPALPGVKERSLATPVGLAVTSDGATLYVAAFGSSKIGVFDTGELESDSFVPDDADHITLSAGGPTGLVLDEARDRLYVLTRFDNGISVVKLSTRAEEAHVRVHTPEPAVVTDGRSLLYDAAFTSSNGEASCSSCHVFGDLDHLAWDLGNPDDVVLNNPGPFKIPAILGTFPDFHPLKGPMTTQSLRGMANHGPMHWRGDRTGGNDPGGSTFDEDAAFKKFNVAFPGLIGRESELTEDEMQAFTDFILTVTYPPNPNRRLDNTLNGGQTAGRDLYFGRITDTLFNCNGCHTLDPVGGFFGTEGHSTFEGETQMFKVPHLRNAYTKVGMFGRPQDAPRGPQIRGFGFLHDGSVDTIRRFLGAGVFDLTNAEQNDLERFMMVFDSNLAPIVGQQTTLTATSPPAVGTRIDLMLARDDALECEVVVKGTIAGEQRGGYRLPDGTFQMDRAAEIQTDLALRALALLPGQELTYTCVPPGSGERIGVDRDGDGVFDHDELDVGSDPADAGRLPQTPVRASTVKLADDDTVPIDASRRRIVFKSARYQGIPSGVTQPAAGSDGDPTTAGASGGGAIVTIHNSAGGDDQVVLVLPAAGWKRTGNVSNPVYKYVDRQRLNGPITSISLRNGTLTIRGKGAQLYPLAGAPQGSVAVRLDTGTRFGFCAVSPAGTKDTTAGFTGAKNAPPPAQCPPMP
jgi:DNA-binding beta-propeller fold protein YncE